MKTYFRLLSFANPIQKFAIPYFIFTALAIIFSTLNLTLLAPLLKTLFSNSQTNLVTAPKNWYDVIDFFNYYAQLANQQYGTYGALKFVCIVIFISSLLGNLFRYFSQRIMENLRIHTLLNLRKAVFNNVMDLHLSYFSNERKGDIMAKVSADVQVVQFSVTGTLQVIFKEPLQLIAYIVMLFLISPKLTLFSILIIPISAFAIARIVKRLKQQATQSQQSYGTMISYLDEALSAIKIIKAFNAVDYIKEKFNIENTTYSKINRSMAKRQQLASPVSEFLGVSMVVGIVLYGGTLVISKQSELKAEEFILYIVLFSQVMRPAKAISDSFSNINQGLAAGERVLELIDTKPAINDVANATSVTQFNSKLTFKNVSFSYGERLILDDINFEIEKGKSIALVGPSGGGKSTLMDMIPRFIEPQSGEILVDQVNIQHLTVGSLRSLMGIVNQESILFNDTIFNNIAFGKPETSIDDVIAAAKIANAHDFIMNTEKGYQTNIGDRGMKLSGGQKQRLSIARAILLNPPIMLLDEATSALDTESEKLVQDALNNLMKNRTSLIIAHRLSTIKNADQIVVLEKGQIVEIGTHSELLIHNGVYKKLIDMQTFND
ncbi:MAG: ABC-type multidrug transport system, ATPase and permease component [Sphingobacteriales bacterium]|nr:ABC-type multidrug transport system, ATPase and permease component [Sphingobacteriales bacterium]